MKISDGHPTDPVEHGPIPKLTRWQPTRLGLIDVFYYDNEEFDFVDGKLNLRGRNGVGKSKVLSLTMPFLFDGYLQPSRMEPDADNGKRMAWNLLVGTYDRRIGYVWMEFGRLRDDGSLEYVTICAGLSADNRRPNVDHWFFIIDAGEFGRVNRDFHLINDLKRTLTKDALREALEGYGTIFDTTANYRRAVNDRLFKMEMSRYDALMEALIQLRQPQLSKRPDERLLSEALTQSLTPLSHALVSDVADALALLDEHRDELEKFKELHKSVETFERHYRMYAGTQTRRQARNLRHAHSEYQDAVNAKNSATDRYSGAIETENRAAIDVSNAKNQLAHHQARLEALQSDPTNQDANRLSHARSDANARKIARDDAAGTLRITMERLESAANDTLAKKNVVNTGEAAIAGLQASVRQAASQCGVLRMLPDNLLLNTTSSDIATSEEDQIYAAHSQLTSTCSVRRDQIAQVRRLHHEVTRAQDRFQLLLTHRHEKESSLVRAEQDQTQAEDNLTSVANRLLEDWQRHLQSLLRLQVSDEGLLEDVSLWIDAPKGENPAVTATESAHRLAIEDIASRRARIRIKWEEIEKASAALCAERDRLQAGADASPPQSHARDYSDRDQRPGAPLWKLIDFHRKVSPHHRAGIEAALEAAGILDAWVAPDGRLQDIDGSDLTQDAQVIDRPAVKDSPLSAWLKVSVPDDCQVSRRVVERLLAGIACSEGDDTSESWISPLGHYRLGALAGAWAKESAAYIGYDAREQARAKRLQEIVDEETHLAAELHQLRTTIEALVHEQQEADEDLKRMPSDEALRGAIIELDARIRAFEDARDQFALADQQYRESEATLQGATQRLLDSATDMSLPVSIDDLPAIEETIGKLQELSSNLDRAAHALRHAWSDYQDRCMREDVCRTDVAVQESSLAKSETEYTKATAHLEVLQEAVGMKVMEYESRIRVEKSAQAAAEGAYERALEVQRVAGVERGKASEALSSADAGLQDASAKRRDAVDVFRLTATSGLIRAALPEAEIPATEQMWMFEPALALARKAEQELHSIVDSDDAWKRVQSNISAEYKTLDHALNALGHEANATQSDMGFSVQIVFRGQYEQPYALLKHLNEEIDRRSRLLSVREQDILEQHLQQDIAIEIQRLLIAAERQLAEINRELDKYPTATGVKFRLQWEPIRELDGATADFEHVRKVLLNSSPEVWTEEQRKAVGDMLLRRISAEEDLDAPGGRGGASTADRLARALDYRLWHRFRVQRSQNGGWKAISDPASSGERALGLTVPMIAAVANFYNQSSGQLAPRLILLDEAFAGIDDHARGDCAKLIQMFDLDFVITSEREWACYPAFPGVSICELQRSPDVDAVYVSRWIWNGKERRPSNSPNLRPPLQ